MKPDFLPATREIEIAGGVRYRPIRSWHTGCFAGEHITSINGDASGCAKLVAGAWATSPPYTVTHRLYWHPSNPEKCVSAFLSYPNGMGCCDEYFWEASVNDCERFTGPTAEEDCEAAIVKALTAAPRLDGAKS